MALKNEIGNYTRISQVNIDDNRVFTETYESENAKNSELGKFSQTLCDSTHCANLVDELDKDADITKTIRNNLISAAYKALKNEPPYKIMIDC